MKNAKNPESNDKVLTKYTPKRQNWHPLHLKNSLIYFRRLEKREDALKIFTQKILHQFTKKYFHHSHKKTQIQNTTKCTYELNRPAIWKI